jgi:hypothetical protein
LPQRTSREEKLFVLLWAYVCIALALVSLGVKPFTYGLSTVMGTSLLAMTSLGDSIMVSSLFSGLNVTVMFSDALIDAQVLVTLICVSLLVYAEVASPSYGGSAAVLRELRRIWMPILAFVVLLFAVTVASKLLLLVP